VQGGDDDDDMLVEHPFNVAVFNIIWRIVAGKRYEVQRPEK
jgi:hypothetical protein